MTDPLDMLDVLDEARRTAMRQREAAVKHMTCHAMRAILDGADPRHVAERCGFASDASEASAPRFAPLSFFGEPIPPADPVERFASWLGHAITELVREKAA